MITKTPGWKCSDGTSKAELADAQEHELSILLSENDAISKSVLGAMEAEAICKALVESADKVVEILKTKERKKRKTNGSPKPRRARLPLAIKGPAEAAAS